MQTESSEKPQTLFDSGHQRFTIWAMVEILFKIEEDPDGGFTARAIGLSIFVEAESIEELRRQIRDAVACHFDKSENRPQSIRLHFVRDEVMAL